MKPGDIKSDHMKNIYFLDMKISDIISNKYSSSSEQPYYGLIKWPLLKPTDKHSHESQFTKMISSLNLRGGTLLWLLNLWYSLWSSFWQSLSKKNMSSIQITQINRLLFIKTIYPTKRSSKFIHIKRKLSIILKIPFSLYCQICNYSFINSTKITCKTYHLHEYWQWLWPSCCCFVFRESSTWRAWNQRSRTCDFISPWRRQISTRITS